MWCQSWVLHTRQGFFLTMMLDVSSLARLRRCGSGIIVQEDGASIYFELTDSEQIPSAVGFLLP